jgi:hypothetical protein
MVRTIGSSFYVVSYQVSVLMFQDLSHLYTGLGTLFGAEKPVFKHLISSLIEHRDSLEMVAF